MKKTVAQLTEELDGLKAEVEQLRAASSTLTVGRTLSPSASPSVPDGIEEMILQLDPDDTVSFANAQMARLLGQPTRKAMLGKKLAELDDSELGYGLLTALTNIARAGNGSQVIERTCPELPPARLPPGERPQTDPLLRFTSSRLKGHVQLVVQDVTRLRWLEQMFSRYVSSKVIAQMATMPSSKQLTMERREVTVLFADLRGFTRLAQDARLEDVSELINGFLSNMVDAIELLDGTVDKFAGDEVMALFNAPVDQPDHALRALICAVEMQRAHQRWVTERSAQKKLTAALGIGLASGLVVVGNTGTLRRMEYTALGHTVNLAGRLVGAAANGEILTVPETHALAMKSATQYSGRAAVPRLSFKTRGPLPFKNVDAPVEVVQVVY